MNDECAREVVPACDPPPGGSAPSEDLGYRWQDVVPPNGPPSGSPDAPAPIAGVRLQPAGLSGEEWDEFFRFYPRLLACVLNMLKSLVWRGSVGGTPLQEAEEFVHDAIVSESKSDGSRRCRVGLFGSLFLWVRTHVSNLVRSGENRVGYLPLADNGAPVDPGTADPVGAGDANHSPTGLEFQEYVERACARFPAAGVVARFLLNCDDLDPLLDWYAENGSIPERMTQKGTEFCTLLAEMIGAEMIGDEKNITLSPTDVCDAIRRLRRLTQGEDPDE